MREFEQSSGSLYSVQRIEISDMSNVRILRDYPNSRYFSSFDFGVISGGYNSFHEAIMFSLPCICIPNTKTGMDDQLARAKVAEESGFMLVEENVTRPRIKKLVSKIIDSDNRQAMIESGDSSESQMVLLKLQITFLD